MKFITLNSQKKAILYLGSTIRCGAGFATRAETVDAVSSLSSSCPEAFKFLGTSTMNTTIRLLCALYFASERERRSGVGGKLPHALDNLAALSSGSAVRQLALRVYERDKSATGSNGNPLLRRCAAAAFREIATRASSQFSDGGSTDIWIKRVLLMAYIGRRGDLIGSLLKAVWDEGGTGDKLTWCRWDIVQFKSVRKTAAILQMYNICTG